MESSNKPRTVIFMVLENAIFDRVRMLKAVKTCAQPQKYRVPKPSAIFECLGML